MEKYQILKDLVKINTIKDRDNKEIIDYIEKLLKEKGLKTELKDKNLIMSYGNKPTFGFLGHTDTVEYIDGWNTEPFTLTDIDNKLYGLGSCDMKGGIAAILDSVLNMDLTKIKNGIKLYFTYDEERNFSGIYDIIKRKEKFPNFMIFGEPTHPAQCYATLDFRIVESKHLEKILVKLEELCKKYDCKYEIVEQIEPFINTVNFNNNGKTANFMTEASFVNCKSKIILGVGPVTAHEVNEYIEKKSYDELVEQYTELIEKFS